MATITHDESCYLDWLAHLVCEDDREMRTAYNKLFIFLFQTPFTYGLMMDENRFSDGVQLRYDYARENDIPYPEVASTIDNRDCSVLEMMIALATKCEHLMQDSNNGFSIGKWFWTMVTSLGLVTMTDLYFDGFYANIIINKFLAREYKPNGEGGLFVIEDPIQDLRHVDIWCQACWYMEKM